ncbi:GspE/PulE family protein [Deinococcus sp. Leaf326]|uniref:GspE/PulE family protein n=1 Tax=Deinococcus sp. Leaf326 TaxID=1736338 RepID=UPI0006FB29BA|nr:GspE/PulE family protein [Deinococcus sp. Leaf326]KQR07448.1 hypothetical protein ASF71_20955 [Deinococcus sp. Leaf326]
MTTLPDSATAQYITPFLAALAQYGHNTTSLQQFGLSPLALARRQGIPEGHLTGALQIAGYPIAEHPQPAADVPADLNLYVGICDAVEAWAARDPFDHAVEEYIQGIAAYAPLAPPTPLPHASPLASTTNEQRPMRTVLDALYRLGVGNLTPEELTMMSYQDVLLDTGRITPVDLAKAYALFSGAAYIDTQGNPPHANVRNDISAHIITSFKIVPHSRTGNVLTVLQSDPTDPYPIQVIEDELQAKGLQVVAAVTTPQAIDQLILSLYHRSAQEERLEKAAITRRQDAQGQSTETLGADLDSPARDRIISALQEAAANSASDLHLQPERDGLQIRERLYGNLILRGTIPKELRAQAINAVKIMAQMNLQLRIPQDNRINIPIQYNGKTQELRLRVSTTPQMHGENIVLRLLQDVEELPTLEQSAFTPANLALIQEALTASNGMILVTGPTGSGKTTLMHSALRTLNDPALKIATIENPIEYEQPGMVQTEIRRSEDPLQDLSFALVLRATLRQDPDIIFVGEIRDEETAEISMSAAQTGHLLLSTLHTNSAIGTITRLKDLGIPSYLIAENLRLVVSQRLVGQPCPDCSVEEPLPQQYVLPGMVNPTMLRGTGLRDGHKCPRCDGNGDYKRIAIHEVLAMTPELRQAIIEDNPTVIERIAREQGMVSLHHDALHKVAAHQANLRSVLRSTR